MSWVEAYLIAIFTFWSIGMGACVWFGICNERTAKDRKRLIDAAFGQANWRKFSDELNSVTYGAHLFSRFRLRDPMKLYSEDFRRITA